MTNTFPFKISYLIYGPLVESLHNLPLQLEGGRDETRFGSPLDVQNKYFRFFSKS